MAGGKIVRIILLMLTGLLPCLINPAESQAAITFSTKWGSAGSGDGQFGTPYGVGVDADGNVYVGDNSIYRIQKFDENGSFISIFASSNIYNASDINFDSSGNLYATDPTGAHYVRKFSSAGTFIKNISSFSVPTAIDFDSSGNFYVVSHSEGLIKKYNSSDTFVTSWAVTSPRGLAIDSNDYIYISNDTNNLIYKYNTSGSLQTSWGGSGSGNGLFSTPMGIAIDNYDNIYIVDQGNDRVQKFNTSGVYQDKVGSAGTGDGQFTTAQDIGVNGEGAIYVSDYIADRVQKFIDDAIVTNVNPNTPSGLGGAGLVDGSDGNNNQPSLSFTLSDNDGADTVKYQIQIDDTSNFSSPVVDYTSALAVQGAASFTVGQAAGSGSYTTGSATQTLTDGSYYWRVKTIDNSSAASEYTTARSGSVAFVIDTAAPTLTGVGAAAEENQATVSWNDTGADNVVAYGLTANYGSNTVATAETSKTITGLVACTTYHYQVTATDTAGNDTSNSDATFTTTGCTGSANVETETAETIIADDGGTLELLDNNLGITLDLPADFTEDDVNLQIKQLDEASVLTTAAAPSGYAVVADYVYDLKAYDNPTSTVSEFDENITVTLTYQASDVAAIHEDSLKIYRWDGSSWQSLSNISVDKTNKQVSGTTRNFSVFGLFGESISGNGSPLPAGEINCYLPAPVGAPNLFQIQTGFGWAKIFFTPVSQMKKYHISYGTGSNAEGYGATVDLNDQGAQNWTAYLLSPATTYYFKVRAQNGCTPGDWSNTVSITTPGLTLTGGQNLAIETVTIEPPDENSPEYQPETGYRVKIRLENESGPLAGAKVEIHSDPKSEVTDDNGEVIFDGVEPGGHQLKIDYRGRTAEEKLLVDGNKQDFNVLIKVNLQPDPWPARILVMIAVILGLTAIMLWRKKS